MNQVHKREAAKRDLVEQFVYLAETSDIDTAERLLLSVEKAFRLLLEHPEAGQQLASRRPELNGVRRWHVPGFENTLIFYLPEMDGITVVRVLHASRDWWAILGL